MCLAREEVSLGLSPLAFARFFCLCADGLIFQTLYPQCLTQSGLGGFGHHTIDSGLTHLRDLNDLGQDLFVVSHLHHQKQYGRISMNSYLTHLQNLHKLGYRKGRMSYVCNSRCFESESKGKCR